MPLYVQPNFQLPPPATVRINPYAHSSRSPSMNGHSNIYEKQYTRPPKRLHISSHNKHYNPPPPPPTWTSAVVSSFLSVGIVEIVIAGLQSLFCSLYLITGHAILHASHHGGYSAPISSSIKAGALGGLIVTLPAILLCVCRRKGPIFLLLSLCVDTVIGAMAGALGALILNPRHIESVLDPIHASRAGALGAIIFSFGLLFLRMF